MHDLKQLAVESLTHLREGGQRCLAVDDEARGILRQWMLQARAGTRQQLSRALPRDEEAPEEEPILSAAEPSPFREENLHPTAPSHGEATPSPTLAPPSSSGSGETIATATHAPLSPAPQSVEEKLAYLVERAKNWPAAKRLGSLRSTMVFSTGNPHARLMLVGEAPGHDEELQCEPFVGPAGRKLNQILQAMGLARQDVYISNICKFRPSMGDNQGTANRAPSPEEIAACLPLILAEIRAIRPVCIVCLGGCAAKGLLNTASSVGSLRGSWLECQGIPVRVTYHPSYLLRTDTRKARRDVWEDMLAVMDKLGMPISSRQQSYFL